MQLITFQSGFSGSVSHQHWLGGSVVPTDGGGVAHWKVRGPVLQQNPASFVGFGVPKTEHLRASVVAEKNSTILLVRHSLGNGTTGKKESVVSVSGDMVGVALLLHKSVPLQEVVGRVGPIGQSGSCFVHVDVGFFHTLQDGLLGMMEGSGGRQEQFQETDLVLRGLELFPGGDAVLVKKVTVDKDAAALFVAVLHGVAANGAAAFEKLGGF